MKLIKIFLFFNILMLPILAFSVSINADDNYEITVNPVYASLGESTTITIVVTDDQGVPESGVVVGLNGCGIITNSTSGSDGKVFFNIAPTTTGIINIYVGSESNYVDETITVTNWVLDIDSPLSVSEGNEFTVTVYKQSDSTPVEGAMVTITGMGMVMSTDSNGQATFSAPQVTTDLDYIIAATADGFVSDTTTITVINVPGLIIILPDDNVEAGSSFTISVYANNGQPVVGVIVNFDIATFVTDISGEVSLVAPGNPGIYNITATHPGYINAFETITIIPGDPTEISYPKGDLEANKEFTIQVISEGLPVENATVYIQGESSNQAKTDSDGNAVLTAPENYGSFSAVIEFYNDDGEFITETIDMSVGSSSYVTGSDTIESDSKDGIGIEIYVLLSVIIIFNIIIASFLVFKGIKKK